MRLFKIRRNMLKFHKLVRQNCCLLLCTFKVDIKANAYNDCARSSKFWFYFLAAAEGSGSPCRIKVIGVGGGGGNAVNRMMESSTGILGVELWAVNTDAQALSRSLAPKKLNIGSLTSRYSSFVQHFRPFNLQDTLLLAAASVQEAVPRSGRKLLRRAGTRSLRW